jgi:hypothetical protein
MRLLTDMGADCRDPVKSAAEKVTHLRGAQRSRSRLAIRLQRALTSGRETHLASSLSFDILPALEGQEFRASRPGFLLRRGPPRGKVGLVFAAYLPRGESYAVCTAADNSPRSHVLSTGFTSGESRRRSFDMYECTTTQHRSGASSSASRRGVSAPEKR